MDCALLTLSFHDLNLMDIELQIPESPATRLLTRDYDPELDDIRSILVDLCRRLEKQAEFVVSGFGQQRWPVDVGTDLPIFLEQLPEILQAVRSRSSTEIELYGQGIERTINLDPVGDSYVATCSSSGVWQPQPVVEQIQGERLEAMLNRVQENFLSFVRRASPALSKHEWLRAWISGS
jgi:hypothetical protein